MYAKVSDSSVPKSNSDCFIIPAFRDRMGFILNGKVPSNLPVDSVHIEECIFQCNKICQTIRCEQLMIEEQDPLESEKFYVSSSWVLFIVGLVIYIVGMQYSDLKTTLTSVGIIFIISPIIISVVIVFIGVARKANIIDKEKKKVERLTDFLVTQNNAYRRKGLQWSLGHQCMWLQLERI